ncbi:MAG TPA: anti-sigma factor [Cytophagales bacterium]|jgi:serine/threonine-protein kinase RsbW|nr:anti-sigma factor [Cytophagales bacterium]
MNYRYNIGCSLSNLKGIRDFVRKTLAENNVSELLISSIVLALDEMCSNVMIHAHHCNPDDFLELRIEHSHPDTFVFEIIDDGSTFDINQFSEPELKNLIHDKRKGGIGIRLVKSIMDKVEYTKEGGRNICRLTKTV